MLALGTKSINSILNIKSAKINFDMKRCLNLRQRYESRECIGIMLPKSLPVFIYLSFFAILFGMFINFNIRKLQYIMNLLKKTF